MAFQFHLWGKAEACEQSLGPGQAAPRCPDAPAPWLQDSSGVTGFHANPDTTPCSTEEVWCWGKQCPVAGLRVRGHQLPVCYSVPPQHPPPIIHLQNGKNIYPTGSLGGLDEARWHPGGRGRARSLAGRATPARPRPPHGPSVELFGERKREIENEREGNAHVVTKGVTVLGAEGKWKPRF